MGQHQLGQKTKSPPIPPKKQVLGPLGVQHLAWRGAALRGASGHSSLRVALATITSLDSSALKAPGLWDTAKEETLGWCLPLQDLWVLSWGVGWGQRWGQGRGGASKCTP